MKKIALLTLLLINLSLSFSLPRNQASPAIFSVTQSAGTILFRHTDSTQTIIPCQSVASIVSNADPSKIVSVWVVQQGDYDKIMQFDYSVCGFSTKQEAVDSVTVWASCLYVSDSAYTTILYTNTDSATITSYDALNSQNAPPVSPATGDVYLVGNNPSGAWAGHAKDIAEWNGSSWDFTDGVQGDFLYNATTALTYIFRSGNWVQTTGIPALNNGNTISSGLKIGTNNLKSLTFETNNKSVSRFDSIGRFYVYNLPTSADTFVNVTDVNGKFGKIGKSSFLSGISGGGSSALLPNGIKLVTESRDLQADDAGYILVLYSETEQIILTIPETSPLAVGDNFAIATSDPAEEQNSGFVFGSDTIKPLLGESVFFTTIVSDGQTTSLPLNTTFIGENTAIKYLYDQSQDAIPLSGTVSGSPVTGDIEIGQDGYKIGIKTGVSNFSGLSFTQSYMALENVANGIETSFSVTNTDGIIVKDNINHIGLIGYEDFSPYISDLDYTQKIYVDSLVGYRGTATLSSGTVTVSTPLVKTGYKIYVSVDTPSGTQGFLSAPTGSIVDGTSFVINSTSVLDNSTVNWWIAP